MSRSFYIKFYTLFYFLFVFSIKKHCNLQLNNVNEFLQAYVPEFLSFKLYIQLTTYISVRVHTTSFTNNRHYRY